MQSSLVFIVPGSISAPTGGYEYDRQVIAGVRGRGWVVELRQISSTFPVPTAAELDDAAQMFGDLPDNTIAVVDGLAFGAMPEVAALHARRLRLVALVHLPLALEVGLDAVSVARFEASERRALSFASAIIATGTTTAETLASRYGVASDRIAVIEPGTLAAPLAVGSGDGAGVQLLCVGTVSHRKGYDVLIDALSRVGGGNWQLTCAGSLERDRAYVALVRERITSAGLHNCVTLAGDADASRLARLYDACDVFVLATRYETYGMAVAEALARGLPIVSTRTGAIPALAGDGAGLLVEVDDVEALAVALSRVIADARLRDRLRAGARRARAHLPTWDQAIDRFVTVLDRVSHDEPIVF